jgi:23S rRNA pseudouridine1911/1915/1917 synthase
VVHPGAGNRDNTLSDSLLKHWPELKGNDRNGLMHRLDKNTSGLLLIAKTAEAHESLAAQFAERTITKRYTALVVGHPKEPEGVIDAPITRHHADRKKMTVRPDGKSAQTTYQEVDRIGDYSLLNVWIGTGRTHQIRVHLAALGHPVVGDVEYGEADARLSRQFLHATELRFWHPKTGRELKVTDDLPEDLRDFLDTLESR